MALTIPSTPPLPHSPFHHNPFHLHRLPQDSYIDALRWLPQLSAFHRHVILAAFDSATATSSLRTLTYSPPESSSDASPKLSPQASHSIGSRVTSLRTALTQHSSQNPAVAAATRSGELVVLSVDLLNGSLDFGFSVSGKGFHNGAISAIDLGDNGADSVVSVGEDGRINLVALGNGGGYQKVFDSNGLVSYNAVKWASPVEFVTGGLGFSLQWWDQRRPGGAVSQFKGNWTSGRTSGIINSVDIHPSRKYTCLAGGSLSTVFTWDIRWPHQSIILSGGGTPTLNSFAYSPPESEVWEVQYDNHHHSSNIYNVPSSRALPAMMCSEAGILAVIEQNEAPVELMDEACAINSLDIDKQNPSDVLCSLEWESIAILTRA